MRGVGDRTMPFIAALSLYELELAADSLSITNKGLRSLSAVDAPLRSSLGILNLSARLGWMHCFVDAESLRLISEFQK